MLRGVSLGRHEGYGPCSRLSSPLLNLGICVPSEMLGRMFATCAVRHAPRPNLMRRLCLNAIVLPHMNNVCSQNSVGKQCQCSLTE